MNRDPWFRALIILLVFIAGSYLANLAWTIAVQFADILLLLALAWGLAFALEPITTALETRATMPRLVAAGIAYLGLLVFLSLLILLLVPEFARQVSQIGMDLPLYVANTGSWITAAQGWLNQRGFEIDAATLLDYREIARRVESLGPVIVNNALGLATGVASLLFSLILVLMFSFYLMLDGARITNAALGALPRDRRSDAEFFIYSTHRAFGGYIRGQIIQAAIYGLGTAAIMLAADLSYTELATVFAAISMMIPFIGPVLALLPPVVISLFLHLDRAWWVFLLLLGLQQVVLNVLSPRIMGHAVGMHPILVLLSLLIGAKLAGLWGAVFAVPVAGVIVAMVGFYRMTVEERKSHMETNGGSSSKPISEVQG